MFKEWMNEMPIIITINGKKYVNGVEVKEYKVEKSIGGTRCMCEYCEKGKIVKSCNFCGSAKMRISCSKEFNILEVQGDKEKFSLFKRQYCPRFDINYCPICGRDLKNN